MEERELFLAIAVAALIVAAVLAAGYLLMTALAGGPGPSPTPVPSAVASPTPTPSATIPSGPLIVPSGSPFPVIPTPVQPVTKSAELAGWGTDKDTYDRGDDATVNINIKNTGTVQVDEARLEIKVERYVSVLGYVNVKTSETTLTGLDIPPGETKNAEYVVNIPSDYEGIPTAGKYRFTVDVYVWDVKIGSFQPEIEVK